MTMETQQKTQAATPLPTPPSTPFEQMMMKTLEDLRSDMKCGFEAQNADLKTLGNRMTIVEQAIASKSTGSGTSGGTGGGTSSAASAGGGDSGAGGGGTTGAASSGGSGGGTTGGSGGGTTGASSGGGTTGGKTDSSKTNGTNGTTGSGGSGGSGTVTGGNAVTDLPKPVPPRAPLSTRDYWTATIAFAAAYFAIPAGRRRGIAHALPLIPAAVGVIDSLITHKGIDEQAVLPVGGAAAGGAAAIALAR